MLWWRFFFSPPCRLLLFTRDKDQADRHTHAHTLEWTPGGLLLGVHVVPLLLLLVFFSLLLFVIVPLPSSFWLFSHFRGSLLGDPFSGTSLGTQDSSEALSVSCPRNRFAEAFSCFLLLLRLTLVGACSFWRLHHTLLEGADPGHTPGGRTRPSAE